MQAADARLAEREQLRLMKLRCGHGNVKKQCRECILIRIRMAPIRVSPSNEEQPRAIGAARLRWLCDLVDPTGQRGLTWNEVAYAEHDPKSMAVGIAMANSLLDDRLPDLPNRRLPGGAEVEDNDSDLRPDALRRTDTHDLRWLGDALQIARRSTGCVEDTPNLPDNCLPVHWDIRVRLRLQITSADERMRVQREYSERLDDSPIPI